MEITKKNTREFQFSRHCFCRRILSNALRDRGQAGYISWMPWLYTGSRYIVHSKAQSNAAIQVLYKYIDRRYISNSHTRVRIQFSCRRFSWGAPRVGVRVALVTALYCRWSGLIGGESPPNIYGQTPIAVNHSFVSIGIPCALFSGRFLLLRDIWHQPNSLCDQQLHTSERSRSRSSINRSFFCRFEVLFRICMAQI